MVLTMNDKKYDEYLDLLVYYIDFNFNILISYCSILKVKRKKLDGKL